MSDDQRMQGVIGKIKDKENNVYDVWWNGDLCYHIHIVDGLMIGHLVVHTEVPKWVGDVLIYLGYRRQGIATALYDFVEKHRNVKFERSDNLLHAGELFWDAREARNMEISVGKAQEASRPEAG